MGLLLDGGRVGLYCEKANPLSTLAKILVKILVIIALAPVTAVGAVELMAFVRGFEKSEEIPAVNVVLVGVPVFFMSMLALLILFNFIEFAATTLVKNGGIDGFRRNAPAFWRSQKDTLNFFRWREIVGVVAVVAGFLI